jgi:hypothetical protein
MQIAGFQRDIGSVVSVPVIHIPFINQSSSKRKKGKRKEGNRENEGAKRGETRATRNKSAS